MPRNTNLLAALTLAALLPATINTTADAQAGPPDRNNPGQRGQGGPGGPPGGPGGPGGPGREDIKLLKDHDHNDDGWLNKEERAEARTALAEIRAANQDGERGQRRGRGRRGGNREPASPGPHITPAQVQNYNDATLYDTTTFRTIFMTFENDDWEKELQDFHNTDVDVPANLLVDGQNYPGVGVRFRGASSYFMIPEGHKRSFNIAVDYVDKDQSLLGYKTLNLLNCNGDDSMMSTVLYAHMAEDKLAAPKANFVKVVVNGEYWGVYVNVQQFDKVFTKENFGSSKGTRWKVPGSPRGDGGLAYDGDDLAPYKERYDMKSNDGDKAWKALVELCKVLNETPLENLVEELSPLLDIDEALWFLAFDVALVNSDGYWTRASDYSLFRDKKGKFHVIPHDMNESFRASRGRGGESDSGITLDPLVSIDNDRMPLRSRLLAVPELREKYLKNINEIASTKMDWTKIGPLVEQYRTQIEDAVHMDTRRLGSYDAFLKATANAHTDDNENTEPGVIQDFFEKRRAFLLDNLTQNSDNASAEDQ